MEGIGCLWDYTEKSFEKNLKQTFTHRKWGKGQITKEKYSLIALNYKDSVRKAKTQNQLRLGKDDKNNKKDILDTLKINEKKW